MPDQQKLLSAIDAAEALSYGSDTDSELSSERARAIDHYNGLNLEPAPEGRSQVVDRSVFETIQWILPSLCRIFANGDDVVELAPFGPEDEEPAKQESEYLNYLVTQKNRWFDICLVWFQDALLTKNAYCMAYIDESVQVETESYESQSRESVVLLTEGDGVEVVGFEEFIDESAQPEPVMGEGGPTIDPQTGQPMMGPAVRYNIQIKRTKPKKKLKFQVLPPERCKVDSSTPDHTLEGADYFEYWDYKTLSWLRAQGFDVEDDIAAGDGDFSVEEDNSRDQYGEEMDRYGMDSPEDPSMRKVKVRQIWLRYDYDEDGIAEMQAILRVGNEILRRDEVSRIPVASIVPAIHTHRHPGISIADITVDIERIKTAILRQGLDSLYQANNPRTAISSKVNLDDMLVSRPGGVIRIEEGGIPMNEIFPIVQPFVFPQAMQGMEYMDQVKENRTGTNRYFTGIDQNALNKTATGIQQLSTMAAQRVEQIARIFASGIENLFSVAHELVLKSGHQAETVKLRGQWVTVDPSQWKTGRDMTIVVGFGAGNKDVLVARLMMILQAQKEAMLGGLRVANEQTVYEALVELTKASDFTAPQRFWTDPSQLPKPEPKPDPVQIGAALEEKKLQSDLQKTQMMVASKDNEVQTRAGMDKYKADLDAQVKLQLEQMKSGGSVDLERFRAQLKNEPIEMGNEKIEQATQVIDALAQSSQAQTEVFGTMLTELANRLEGVIQSVNAPRQVVRDKKGRVSGVKVGDLIKNVVRDAEGKVTGIQ